MADIAAWANVAIAGISAIGAVIAWWRSNLSRHARDEAQDAQARAEATLRAVQEQAEASSRSAAAMEQIAKRAAEQTAAAQAAPPWRVEHVDRDTYAVINDSATTMHDVDIEVPDTYVLDKDGFPTDIDGNSRKSFFFVTTITAPDRSIVITWLRPDGTRGKWSGEIPPRPPRKR